MFVKYKLHVIRKSKHMTQRQLAKRSGVSTAMISFIERGKRHPTFETLILLAMGLGVKIPDLIKIDEDNRILTKYI